MSTLQKIVRTIYCVTAILIFISLQSCNGFSAGSYPYAEIYDLPFPEQSVINAVKKFKSTHSEIIVPIEGLSDGYRDYWYHVYFYLPAESKIAHCWIRPKSTAKTSFAIVGINIGLKLGNWMKINKDFDNDRNKEEIKLIEKKILNPIITILTDSNHLQ